MRELREHMLAFDQKVGAIFDVYQPEKHESGLVRSTKPPGADKQLAVLFAIDDPAIDALFQPIAKFAAVFFARVREHQL